MFTQSEATRSHKLPPEENDQRLLQVQSRPNRINTLTWQQYNKVTRMGGGGGAHKRTKDHTHVKWFDLVNTNFVSNTIDLVTNRKMIIAFLTSVSPPDNILSISLCFSTASSVSLIMDSISSRLNTAFAFSRASFPFWRPSSTCFWTCVSVVRKIDNTIEIPPELLPE